MQVLNAAAAAPAAATNPTAGATGSVDKLTNESTFLQLLVAQIQNQDPLNPADSTQFIGQLVSFSQLEQLLGINQGVQSLIANTGTTPPPATPTPTPPATPGNTIQP
jgi:flagellar basal-body rod modification protein FlgD